MNVRIARALPQHLARIPEIERSAARLLAGHAPAAVLDEATDADTLRAAQSAGLVWVALDDGEVVGYARAELLAPDLPHLAEIDVLPSHGRRGIGTALVRAVCAWAGRSGHRQITLTTFRAVPFNMPFYARLGFEEVPAAELRPELAAVVAEEAARGLDPSRRAVMRCSSGASTGATRPAASAAGAPRRAARRRPSGASRSQRRPRRVRG